MLWSSEGGLGGAAFSSSGLGSSLTFWDRRRRTRNQINPAMRATAQTPPTTPSAMAPVLEELCVASGVTVDDEVAVEEAVVEGAVVDVDVDSVDCLYLIRMMA